MARSNLNRSKARQLPGESVLVLNRMYLAAQARMAKGELTYPEGIPEPPIPRFRIPFWLWPNLLGLDAPLIAVLWQLLLSRTVAPIHTAATVVLGLSVWLVYTVDRVLDTTSPAARPESLRHQFARAYRVPLILLAIPVFALDVALALVYLPAAHLLAGIVLVVAVALRFAGVLLAPTRRWPKDLSTALIFAAGVWTPILLVRPLLPGALLFVLLCWWNCRAIETWEAQPVAGFRILVSAALLAAASLTFFLLTDRPVALAETLSATGFCVLAQQAPRWSPAFLRVAVDLCLLSPLFVMAVC